MTAPAIQVQKLWKYFGDFPAVRDVTFEVQQGSITALLGRNGAGKTTLLRMIAGLSRPTQGQVQVGQACSMSRQEKETQAQPTPEPNQQQNTKPVGRNTGLPHTNQNPTPQKNQNQKLGVIGHGQWIYDDLTAEENLTFFANLYDVQDAKQSTDQWLDQVGLGSFKKTRAGDFSRGMRQRLAIARAFLHEPEVLLLDEPWTALDDRAIHLLSSLLTGARQKQRTVLVCSHQLTETLDLATDLLVLDRGRLAFTGPNTEELRTKPQDFYQRVL